MQNKKFPYALIIILLVILAGYFVLHRKTAEAPILVTPKNEIPISVGPSILGDKENFVSFSIAPGESVSGKVTATGTTTGGYFFEANIGMQILDVNKKVLRSTNGTATTDWMTAGPVSFTTNLDFTGLLKGPGYIRIHNDNPSGLAEYDKYIDVPIIISAQNYSITEKLQFCPEVKIFNLMPGISSPNDPPKEYYVYKSKRYEISEFDSVWLQKNCSIKEEKVF